MNRRAELQAMVDAHRGRWICRLPHVDTGATCDLFYGDPRYDWLRECAEMLDLRWGATADILDVGTLEGATANALAKTGARVVGIESNPEAFDRAMIASQVVGGRYTVHCVAFEDLAPPQSWDGVLLSGVLYHQRDPAAMLARAAAMLSTVVRDGMGTPWVYVWTHCFRGDPAALRDARIVADGIEHAPQGNHLGDVRSPRCVWFSEPQLATMIRAAGLSVVSIKRWNGHPHEATHGPAYSVLMVPKWACANYGLDLLDRLSSCAD